MQANHILLLTVRLAAYLDLPGVGGRSTTELLAQHTSAGVRGQDSILNNNSAGPLPLPMEEPARFINGWRR